MTKSEFDDQVTYIVKLIEKLKERFQHDEMNNADGEPSGYDMHEGWGKISEALERACSE
jgi:hypothetical protein